MLTLACLAGGKLEDGWKAIKVVRKDANDSADAEIIYFSPSGKKLRSRRHVFDFLQIPHDQASPSQTPAASHSSHLSAAAPEGTSGPAATCSGPVAVQTEAAAAVAGAPPPAHPPAPAAAAGEHSHRRSMYHCMLQGLHWIVQWPAL